MEARCPFTGEVKREFYGDFRMLQDEMLSGIDLHASVFRGFDRITHEEPETERFYALERAMKLTIEEMYSNFALANTVACSYSGNLDSTLTRKEFDSSEGSDEQTRVFLEVAYPGGFESPVLITGLLRRMSEARDVFGISAREVQLAKNSKPLLKGAMQHPQQWAVPFMYAITDLGYTKDPACPRPKLRSSLLTRRFIKDYMLCEHPDSNEDASLKWCNMEDFPLSIGQRVVNRLATSEFDPADIGIRDYPAGTRLGDIELTEDAIGCPGARIAYRLWDIAIEVADQQDLWPAPLQVITR